VPYGEKAVFTRTATVKRAGPLERAWTKATGDIEFMELLEFSFSSESEL
jgi:late competence protein required for DNA uptake (superfamily II DNA/RNA helicase)